MDCNKQDLSAASCTCVDRVTGTEIVTVPYNDGVGQAAMRRHNTV